MKGSKSTIKTEDDINLEFNFHIADCIPDNTINRNIVHQIREFVEEKYSKLQKFENVSCTTDKTEEKL